MPDRPMKTIDDIDGITYGSMDCTTDDAMQWNLWNLFNEIA